MKTIHKTLEVFQRGGDGAHCGLTDWYPKHEAALRTALKAKKPFDTGWYASKKEIASARIYSMDGKHVNIEVSVSDDFDTNGMGRTECSPTIKSIRSAIHRAWDKSEEDQKANRQYAGYSLHRWSREIPQWLREPNIFPREKRKQYRSKQPQCLDYYIVCISEFCDRPPGYNYHYWGWQSDPDESENAGAKPDPDFKLPADIQEKFEDFAQSLKPGSLRIGDWEIRAWDTEDEA